MSFGGFGTSTPAAGASFTFGPGAGTTVTPIKSAGFGSTPSLFGTPASTAQPSFGTPAATTTTTQSLFGTPAAAGTQQPPAFGTGVNFNLGATAPTSSVGGTGFGGFGGFGTTATTTSAPSLFSGFGTTATTTSAPALFSGFGTTATTTSAPSLFSGFGTTTATTSAPSLFSGFGTTATTTSAPALFSGFGATNTQKQPSAFGSTFGGFGAKPAGTTTGFGNFGTAQGSGFGNFGSNFGQPQQQEQQQQQQQQQQQVQSNNNALSEALYNAVFNCQLFNDERDNTIARWNLIQALWGTGKAYYFTNAPPLELNQENPLCRFKAIGYSRIPDADNNDGLVVLCFAKKEQELRNGKPQVIASLHQILGNKPNLTVTVDTIKSIGETKGQITIFVTEKGATGSLRKIPANELFAYLTQNMQKQQLTQIGVENIFPQVKLDPAQLREYLDNPPCFIDPRLWKQAQLDNPNPECYIPVPMIGFQQVKHRLKCQEQETGRHRAFLDMAANSIQDLQRQHTVIQARLKEHRRSLLELQHRLLQILVKQEITRKIGFSLQPEEEVLTNKFEAMHSQISAPTQFKGRISEMLSQLRMRRHIDSQIQERYTMDPIAQDDIRTYLNMEQQGMQQLIGTVNADLESLKIIKDGMSELTVSPGATL